MSPTLPSTPAGRASGRRVAVVVLFVVALLAGGAFLSTRKGGAATPGKGGPGGKAPERKVPVLVEPARRLDVPIVLEGLGTVTPLATVQLKSQVDGRLQSVAFKEGALVKKGELLAQIDPRPFQIAVAQTAATLARDQAQLRNARLMLSRNTSLRAQDMVPQQAVDDQQTVVDQLEATLAIDQAASDNAKLQLEYSRLTAPIDGVAGIRQIDPGNLIRASDATGLVLLTQLDPISVVFTLPQDELGRLQTAMSAKSLQVEAWSRDGRALLAVGALAVIDNQINSATGTVRLRAAFPNPTRALWPNQFVKARVTVDQRQKALVIASAAIQRGPQGTFVYVVGDDHTAQLRPVEVDVIEGPLAVLLGGVDEGQAIVTDGQSQLKPGSAVDPRVQDAAAVGPKAKP
jgi:multidrug efflux system membrane fusion protein